MKKQLSFGLTATIMVASLFLYIGLLAWLQTTLNLPDWVSTISYMVFFLLVFEIPSRLGPEPFDTFLSGIFKWPWKDKIILYVSIGVYLSLLILVDDRLKQMPLLPSLSILLFMVVVLIGPIMIFGSPETKKDLFKKNKSG
jgi:hypothetical protein